MIHCGCAGEVGLLMCNVWT